MLNEFVEKILVHERARKGSQDTTQEIEIYFNFLFVPHFIMELVENFLQRQSFRSALLDLSVA